MVDFLKSEAGEKCMEIKQKARFEYERRFRALIIQKKAQVDAEYKQRRQHSHIQRLIDSARKKSEANSGLSVLRGHLVETVRETVIHKLANIEQNPQYAELMTNLIVQGLIAVQEETCSVRCRKIDEPIVKKILARAEQLFKKAVEDSTGYLPHLEPLTIDTENYLPGPYKEGAVEYCLGGVEVVARQGKIVNNNRLDKRLELAFKNMLPHIRAYLFGEVPRKVNDGTLPHHLTNF